MTNSHRFISIFSVLVMLNCASGARWSDNTDQKVIDISGNWINCRPVRLTSLKGRILVIEFWSTTSRASRSRIVELNNLRKKYTDKGVVIISVTNEKEKTVKKFMKDIIVEYPVISDGEQAFKAYNIPEVPHVVLAGTDGKIAWDHRHDVRGLEEKISEQLEKDNPKAVPGLIETSIPEEDTEPQETEKAQEAQEPRQDPEQAAGQALISARRLRAARRYTDALEAYRSITAHYPGTDAASKARTAVGELSNDPDLAAREQARKEQRKRASLLSLGKSYLANGMTEKAMALFKKIVETHPRTDEAEKAKKILDGLPGD